MKWEGFWLITSCVCLILFVIFKLGWLSSSWEFWLALLLINSVERVVVYFMDKVEEIIWRQKQIVDKLNK